MMQEVQKSIEVDAPISECYRLWTHFLGYPDYLVNVDQVTATDRADVWHWRLKGPQGQRMEYDVRVEEMDPNRRIYFRTTEEAPLFNSGEICFYPAPEHGTIIDVTMRYSPPRSDVARQAAEAIFHNPDAMVKRTLENFNRLMMKQPAGVKSQGGLSEIGNIMGAPSGSPADISMNHVPHATYQAETIEQTCKE